jgi:ribosomal protein S12 methylthiotransferase accessory factor
MDINVDFPGGAKVDAHIGSFTVHSDQPVKDGGDDSAPSPFLLFQASLATCAGYYVYGFCKARNIPMDGIKLIQRTETDPNSKLIGKIKLEIQLPASFPKEYASAVVRAAESCTVKKHLEHPPAFEVYTSIP